jgi:hypothetical protein
MFLEMQYLMYLPFGAANGLVIMALWAENVVQQCLVNFESQYTTGEVFYLYQNTQTFIQKENQAQRIVIFAFVSYIAINVACIYLIFGKG